LSFAKHEFNLIQFYFQLVRETMVKLTHRTQKSIVVVEGKVETEI